MEYKAPDSERPLFTQHAVNQRHGKSHHIAVIPFNARNPARSNPLNRISPSLIHRLTGCNIFANVFVRQFTHSHKRSLRSSCQLPVASRQLLIHVSQRSPSVVRVLPAPCPVPTDHGPAVTDPCPPTPGPCPYNADPRDHF